MYKDSEGKDKPRTVTDGGISAIVQNMEKLISFSWGQFRFVDSFAFLNSSLDKLVKNTPRKIFVSHANNIQTGVTYLNRDGCLMTKSLI